MYEEFEDLFGNLVDLSLEALKEDNTLKVRHNAEFPEPISDWEDIKETWDFDSKEEFEEWKEEQRKWIEEADFVKVMSEEGRWVVVVEDVWKKFKKFLSMVEKGELEIEEDKD